MRRIVIPPDRYEADLELHDRFLQFSAELLRMAIGGVAAIGFLVSLLAGKGALPATIYRPSVYLPLVAAVAAFALAGGAALAHRFLAADGMFHHLRAIKHLILSEKIDDHPDLSQKTRELTVAARYDEFCRNRKFRSSETMLFASAVLLFAGVASLGGSIVSILLGGPEAALSADKVVNGPSVDPMSDQGGINADQR